MMPEHASGSDRRWVSVQLVLMTFAVVGGPLEALLWGRGFNFASTVISILVGLAVVVTAVFVLRRSQHDLAGNLTATPTPVADGHLVDTGIYGIVRHPMYLGALLGAFGFALLLGSWVALAVAILMIPFFFAKSRHEESLLESRYPTYGEYRERVRSRFVPWLV